MNRAQPLTPPTVIQVARRDLTAVRDALHDAHRVLLHRDQINTVMADWGELRLSAATKRAGEALWRLHRLLGEEPNPLSQLGRHDIDHPDFVPDTRP